MSGERYDLFRLYLANMEQLRVMKRALGFALVLIGVIAGVYMGVFLKNYPSLWLVFFFLVLVYFVLGEFIVGAMVYAPPERIIKWAASQKFREPEKTNAGELAATAAKLLRNGNLTVSKELLDQVFRLKRVGPQRLVFASTVLADLYRSQEKLDNGLKALKNNVLRKKREVGAYSMLVLGRIYLEQGQNEKAVEALESANNYLKAGNSGIPDLYKSGFKNREFRGTYREALQVFVPFYLGKAYYWSPGGEQSAAQNFNSAVVLCRNRHLRPLLKEDFAEKESD